MNLTSRGKIFLVICILSFIFSYFIITLNDFPHLGMSASLLLFALFSYKYKEVKNPDTKLYLVFSLLFSILIFIRSEPLISFLNLAAALIFGFLMLLPSQKQNLGFTDYIYAPFLFVIKCIFTKSDYYLEFKRKKENSGMVKITEVVFGILITIFLLVVVLPLLSSANPIFKKVVLDFWNLLGLENLLNNIGFESVFIFFLRMAFFFLFIYMIPKVITLINKSSDYSLPLPFKQESFPLLIPKVILAIILIIFFITQIQFYFATEETLKNLGFSHSQRTREVFAQLSLVALIVVLFIYNSRQRNKFNQLINWLLGMQGIFLTLMAFKSDFEYINAWGLTYKRLYGLAFATWITGIFIILFKNFRHKDEAMLFVRKSIIFSGVILLMVGVLNFDYLIYHFQKAKTGQGIDYTFLSTLSADSFSYRDQILKLEEMSDEDSYSQDVYDNKNPLIIVHKIENLQEKYSRFDLRTLSLFDFMQYQQIKSQDTKKLRTRYEIKPPSQLMR